MTDETSRAFKAIIGVGELAGKRVEVVARSIEEAFDMLKEQYGAEAVVSLWNEKDSNAPR